MREHLLEGNSENSSCISENTGNFISGAVLCGIGASCCAISGLAWYVGIEGCNIASGFCEIPSGFIGHCIGTAGEAGAEIGSCGCCCEVFTALTCGGICTSPAAMGLKMCEAGAKACDEVKLSECCKSQTQKTHAGKIFSMQNLGGTSQVMK